MGPGLRRDDRDASINFAELPCGAQIALGISMQVH
jgi:hypothetical protein